MAGESNVSRQEIILAIKASGSDLSTLSKQMQKVKKEITDLNRGITDSNIKQQRATGKAEKGRYKDQGLTMKEARLGQQIALDDLNRHYSKEMGVNKKFKEMNKDMDKATITRDKHLAKLRKERTARRKHDAKVEKDINKFTKGGKAQGMLNEVNMAQQLANKYDSLSGSMRMSLDDMNKIDKGGASMNTMFGKMGMRLRKATHGLRGFRMEALGVMFFGMMLQRSLVGLLKPAMQLFGIFDLWGIMLQIVFLPIVKDELFPAFMKMFDWFMSLGEGPKKLIGAFVLLGIGLGIFLGLFGQFMLGIGSIILLGIGNVIVYGIVFVAVLAGIVAIMAGFYLIQKGQWEGIGLLIMGAGLFMIAFVGWWGVALALAGVATYLFIKDFDKFEYHFTEGWRKIKFKILGYIYDLIDAYEKYYKIMHPIMYHTGMHKVFAEAKMDIVESQGDLMTESEEALKKYLGPTPGPAYDSAGSVANVLGTTKLALLSETSDIAKLAGTSDIVKQIGTELGGSLEDIQQPLLETGEAVNQLETDFRTGFSDINAEVSDKTGDINDTLDTGMWGMEMTVVERMNAMGIKWDAGYEDIVKTTQEGMDADLEALGAGLDKEYYAYSEHLKRMAEAKAEGGGSSEGGRSIVGQIVDIMNDPSSALYDLQHRNSSRGNNINVTTNINVLDTAEVERVATDVANRVVDGVSTRNPYQTF